MINFQTILDVFCHYSKHFNRRNFPVSTIYYIIPFTIYIIYIGIFKYLVNLVVRYFILIRYILFITLFWQQFVQRTESIKY